MTYIAKRSNKKIVLCIAAVFVTCFIFYQSSQSAAVSDGYSLGVLALLREVMASLPFLDMVTNHVLRKVAHWFEFFLQACLLCFMFVEFDVKRHYVIYILFVGLLTAVFDEYIQLFVPGRAAMVQDVLLDFMGTASGLIFYLLFWRL